MNQNARVSLTGNSASDSLEQVGTLALNAGDHIVTVTSGGSGRVTRLAAAGLTRSNSATALVRGTSLNQTVGTDVSRITLGTAPTGADFVGTNSLNNGAVSDSTPALKIVPWLIGDSSAGGTGGHFVTYDATLGLRVLTTAEETALTAGYSTPAAAPNATSTGTIAITAANPTVNSLMFVGTSALSGTGTFTVNSGAVGSANVATSIGGFTTLSLGNGEGIFNVTGNTLTVNSAIGVSSSGGITKAGAGNLVLGSAANTFTGTTTVNNGTLQFGAGINNALNGTTGTALQVNAGTFNTVATTQTIATLGLANNATVSGSGGTLNLGGNVTYDATGSGTGATVSVSNLNLNGTRTVTVGDSTNAATDLTISGIVANGTGTNGITKQGAGALLLSNGGNSYTGTTTVDAGTLTVNTTAAGVTGATVINKGGNFTITNNGVVANSDFTINSGGTFTLNNSSGSNITRFKSLTMNGGTLLQNIANDGTEGASGAFTSASGANVLTHLTYSAKNGKLSFGSFSRAAGSTLLDRGDDVGGKTTTTFVTAPSGAQLVNNALIGVFVGAGSGSGTATAVDATNIATYASSVVNAVTATNQGPNAAFTGNATTNYRFTGAIGQTGTANANSVNLGTSSSINGAHTFNVTSGMILATDNSNIGGSTAGTLAFGSAEGIVYVNGLTGSGKTLTIGSVIIGSNGLTFTGGINGAGTLALDGANTFTGTATLNSGTLILGNALALQNSTLNYNNQGGALSFGTQTAATFGSLKGAQNLALTNTNPASVALTVGNNNATNDLYSGILSGGGSLTKVGTGTQTLTGVNNYTGATRVQNGTLALGSAGTISNDLVLGVSGGTSGTLDVSAKSAFSQANISGTGTIDIGTGKTITATGNVGPGFSPGSVAVTGSFTLAGTASTTIEVAGTGGVAGTDFDFMSASETFTYGGTLAIVEFGGYDLSTPSQTFNLFDSVNSFAGTFTSVTVDGNTLTFGGGTWSNGTYSFAENTGILTVVPEPSTFAMLLGGFGMLIGFQRARRRAKA